MPSLSQKSICSGPIDAKILLVGEAPGEQEVIHGVPFVGGSGRELDSMLREASLAREQIRVTNVCNIRPPAITIAGKTRYNDIAAFMPKSAKDAKAIGARLLNGKWVTQEIVDGLAGRSRRITAAATTSLRSAGGLSPCPNGPKKPGSPVTP